MKKQFKMFMWVFLIGMVGFVACQSKKKAAKPARKDMLAAIKEFHKVLHPLQHEAVPAENVQAIRDSLDHLLALGDSLYIAPMPKDWQDIADTLDTLKNQFKANGEALKEAAKGKDDKAVLDAFEKYHNSFETMIHTLVDKGKLKPHKEEGEKEKGSEKKE